MGELHEHKHKWYTFGCKDATYLMTKEDYASLSLSEKFLLSFHKLICKYCRRFSAQSQTIRNLFKSSEAGAARSLPKEKKEALNQLITKNAK